MKQNVKCKNIFLKTILLLILCVNVVIANIVVDYARTDELDASGNENITITNSGSIATNDFNTNSLNVEGTLLNGYEIVNDGNITGESSALFVYANDGTIINRGSISGVNGYSKGILIASDNNGAIENYGNIYGRVAGIKIFGNNVGSITNNASIYGKSYAIQLVNENNKGFIVNNANAVMHSLYNSTIYINLENESSGSIINRGLIESDEYKAIEIRNNAGLIKNEEDASIVSHDASIYIYLDNTSTGSIINQGSIKSDGLYGIEIEGNNAGIIKNEGSLENCGILINKNNSNVISNYGTMNFIKINGDSSSEIDNYSKGVIRPTIEKSAIFIGGNEVGTILNRGELSAEYSLDAPNSTSGNFYNYGTATGTIDAKGVTVVNTGTINLFPQSYIRSESYYQNAGSVLNVGLQIGDDLSVQMAHIQTSGDVTLGMDSKININFTNTSDETISKWFDSLSDSKIAGYKDFKNNEGVLISAGGDLITLINTLDFTDNSTLLDFSADSNGTDINLIVKKATSGLTTLAARQDYLVGDGVAKALDTIFASSNINKDIDTFLTVLDTESTDEQKTEDLTKATPLSNLSSASAIFQTGNIVNNIISQRQSSGRGLNSGDKTFTDRNFWIRPYVSYVTQDNEDDNKGFTATIKGFVMGVDGKYNDTNRFGLAFAYGSSDVDTNDIPQSSDINSFSFMAYGSLPIIDANTNISYQVGLGVQKVDSNRYIDSISKTASANYNSSLYYVQAKINRNIYLKNGIKFVPMVKVLYRFFHNPSYSESGAGGMDLNVDSYNISKFIAGTGGMIAYAVNQSTNVSIFANVDYDFNNNAETVSSSFQGASDVVFQTTGIKESSCTFKVGLNLNRRLMNNSSFNIGYSIDRKSSGFTNQSIYAKYNVKF